MVDTNVRVTKDTHLLIKTLADLWGVTMSDAMAMLINEHVPEVKEALKRREEIQRKLNEKKPDQN